MIKKVFLEIIYVLLILLFVYTATSKLVNLQQTYKEMNGQPFPDWTTPFLVWGISLLELLIAGFLLFNKTKKAGLWGSLILMSSFTIYIGAILLRFFDQVPCSCGGVIEQLGWTNHLYFNLFFVAISILALVLLRKQKKGEQYIESRKVVLT